MINSRIKGKRGELEWVHYLRSQGFCARRSQQVKGTVDSFDVESDCPVERWEVKRVEKLNLYKTVEQAKHEAEGQPYGVAWRKNQGDWVVAIDADTFFRLLDDIAIDAQPGGWRSGEDL